MLYLAGGDDYQEIRAALLDVILTFSNTNRQQSFNLAILDDSVFEHDVEDFMLELKFDPFLTPPSNVILNPNVSTIEILDDDCKVQQDHTSNYYQKYVTLNSIMQLL